MPDSSTTDVDLEPILSSAKTVAVVGISSKKDNPGYGVAEYLIEQGFKVFAVNPNCDEILGQKCYPDLKSIPEHVDVVDIFRQPNAIPAIVEEAIEIGAGTVWMQLGLEHEEAAKMAKRAGLNVVMNRCMGMEHHKRRSGNGKNSPSSTKDSGKPA